MSKRITFRMDDSLYSLIEKRALSDNKTLSEVIVEVLSDRFQVNKPVSDKVEVKSVGQKDIYVKPVGQVKSKTPTPVIDAKEQARLDIAAMLERQKSKVKPPVVASFGSKRVE